jgi:hypothetical protein
MRIILYVSFFLCTVLAVLSAAEFASTLLSIRRRRRANLPHSSFEDKCAAVMFGSALLTLTGMGITAVELWPSSAFSWAFLVLVNVLLQPLFLLAMTFGIFNLSKTIRGRVESAGKVDHELANPSLREHRRRLWPRTIGDMVMTSLFAGWSFACLSPFF